MKFKIDENLPGELGEVLSSLGHSADTVQQEGLQGQIDRKVWEAAQVEERFLITQDLDFSDARQFEPGAHAGLMVVRLREPTRARLLRRLTQVLQTNSLDDFRKCLIVVSDSRIRIRRQ